jgi:CheY-like chemotaxis protein
MDNEMPNCDGPTATRRILKFLSDRQMKRIPIICVTGNVTDEKKRECLDSGMTTVFYKPVKMDEILDALFQNLFQTDSLLVRE